MNRVRCSTLFFIICGILACADNTNNSINNDTYVRHYTYTEVPPLNCQDISLMCAVWAERNGYEAFIYIGELHGEAHAQAGMFDFEGKHWWLKYPKTMNDSPGMVYTIQNWIPESRVTTDEFLVYMHKWALLNNFYRE